MNHMISKELCRNFWFIVLFKLNKEALENVNPKVHLF